MLPAFASSHLRLTLAFNHRLPRDRSEKSQLPRRRRGESGSELAAVAELANKSAAGGGRRRAELARVGLGRCASTGRHTAALRMTRYQRRQLLLL